VRGRGGGGAQTGGGPRPPPPPPPSPSPPPAPPPPAPGAPGTPTVNLPLATAQFHPWELFDFSWSAVPGAAYYLLEMDNEPSFARPWTNATYDHILGTTTQLSTTPGTIFYRIRAVGADGMRGIPSPTRTVVVAFNAPLPPPP